MKTANQHTEELDYEQNSDRLLKDNISLINLNQENKRLKEQNEKLTKALAAEMVSNQMQANLREKLEEKLKKLSNPSSLDQNSSRDQPYAILKYY